MIRKIIKIDEERCNGCGLCAGACHEGAIGMVNGKAKLLRDDYCDGLGDCLPACPTGAISFEEREAAAYNEKAVQEHLASRTHAHTGGCPGSAARAFARAQAPAPAAAPASELRQWPVQIKLAPLAAPFYQGADLLVAADCTAYAYAALHQEFLRGRITLIGCPKLDGVDYSEKLAEILRGNEIRSVTVVRMEVPCCGGLETAVRTAVRASGKELPVEVAILSTQGQRLA